MKVHSALGPGFLESVYRNALVIELREAGYQVEVEKRLSVYYREHLVGEFIADLIVNGTLIVELKAIQALTTAHGAQLVNYLTAMKIDRAYFSTSVLTDWSSKRSSTSINVNRPIPPLCSLRSLCSFCLQAN